MIKPKDLSSEELADMARRGIITELAKEQQELTELLERKNEISERKAEIIEREMRVRVKLEETYNKLQ